MKIAILGSRGIPNNYGGFEQCAEKIAEYFVANGHEVTVYNQSDHIYQDKEYKGIKIRHIFAAEKKLKLISTMIYDFLSLKSVIKEDFDVILELGYNPAGLFFPLFKRKLVKNRKLLFTNMDGLEWKRSKFNFIFRKIIKIFEKCAVKYSDFLISDNLEIKNYYLKNFNRDSICIEYGAEIINDFDETVLKKYDLKKFNYNILIARLEPENNIEMILDGYEESGDINKMIVVGNMNTKFSKKIYKKFENNEKIFFVGGIYDYMEISSLRHYAKIYFHGHSVGGTNPSLLEAMASSCYICAHGNNFNKSVLGEDSQYFFDKNDVSIIIKKGDINRAEYILKNQLKIKNKYTWDIISKKYLNLFYEILKNKHQIK